MISVVIRLFFRRMPAFLRFFVIGIIILIVGLVIGISSHRVYYQNAAQNTIEHYISDSDTNTGYIQLTGSSTLYFVHEKEFSPIIDGINTFKDGDKISIVFSPSNTTDVDVSSTLGTHLTGTSYQVVQITAVADNNSQTVYNSSEYISNPQGYYQNYWGIGVGVIIVGLLLCSGGVFFFIKRPQVTRMPVAPATLYQQPYQNMQQYQYQQPGQYPQPGQYQQQPDQYAQPSQYQQPGQYPPGAAYPNAPQPTSEQYGSYAPTVQANQPPPPAGQYGSYEPTVRATPPPDPYNHP